MSLIYVIVTFLSELLADPLLRHLMQTLRIEERLASILVCWVLRWLKGQTLPERQLVADGAGGWGDSEVVPQGEV